MNYKISFQELAKVQKEILSKQQPTTLSKAKKQVGQLKQSGSHKMKKQRS